MQTELRRDGFSDRWVIIAKEPARQPGQFEYQPFRPDAGPCGFCEGHESEDRPEVYAERPPGLRPNGPGWTVRVEPSRHPRLQVEGKLDRRAEGFHDLMNGVGAHEIVVETPRHGISLHELSPEQIAGTLRAWSHRITDLRKDERIRYVLIYKNRGATGARGSSHSVSEVMGLPITPASVRNKLRLAREYYAEKERCIYCDVLGQERDDGRRLVAENSAFLAYAPFASRFAFEVTVLPKVHSCEFTRCQSEELAALARLLREVLGKLERVLPGAPYILSLQNIPRRRLK